MKKVLIKIQLALVFAFIYWSPFTTFADEECVFNRSSFTKDAKGAKLKEFTVMPIPVDPTKKYRISFTASTTGDHILKKHERIRIMNSRYAGNRLRLKFYDKDGKGFKYDYSDIVLLTDKPRNYTRVFYPPAKAASLRIFPRKMKGGDITVEKIMLWTNLEGKEAKYLNVHPTFDYGDFNSYGFACGGGGRFFTRPDGKIVWNTGFIGWSPFFPVQGDKYYKFFCRGKKSQGKGWIWINFYKKDGKKIKAATVKINEKGAVTILKMPTGTVSARLQCYYVIIEEFTVVMTKDE